MDTSQIYSTVNSITAQAMGKSPITVVDTSTFVALGNYILNSQNTTEPWLNTIVQQIAYDIVEGRVYRSKFRPFFKNSIEWGNIVRKLTVDMPEMTEEESVELVDGQSIDHYKVALPVAHQYLFISRTPYKTWITIQKKWLSEAFRSEADMERFVGMIFQKVRNKLELCVETLARHAMNNYAGIAKESQTYNLVSMYNAMVGEADNVPVGEKALLSEKFVRWAIGVMMRTSTDIESMSVLYNYDQEARFSTKDRQNMVLLSSFISAVNANTNSITFNKELTTLKNYISVPYFQGTLDVPTSSETPTTFHDWKAISKIDISTKKPSGTVATFKKENVIGFLFDDDALGCYRKRETVATTPMNASGLYTNTFFHENQMWFNATDENFILFTLN